MREIKGSIRDLIFILSILALILAFLYPPDTQRIVEANYSGEGKNASSTIRINNNNDEDFFKAYPTSVLDREIYIGLYMAHNYSVDYLSNQEINNLVKIAKRESGNLDPNIEPATWVLHCRRFDNTYYSRELNRGGTQDTCNEYDTQVHREKSRGFFQFLPSTFKRYECKGNIANPNDQIDCAVKVYKKSGYGAWYNSARKEGLI